MWITKDSDGPVVLHTSEPKLDEGCEVYASDGTTELEITDSPDLYEDIEVTYEGGPVKVKLVKE